ncbi:MAG TPA: heparan N-sulfatase [Verrucomicrobiales bacterium]|nr:heparan N-sulfatase [Verrucomicrobiales bacterium]
MNTKPPLFYLLLCLVCAFALHSEAAPAPRNVVLFIADDMGQDAGCYNNPDVKTPALDQLAHEGTRYRFAFCTTASCSASRSVILSGLQNHATGHYGHAHGSGHFSTFGSVQSLPVILSRHGYRTGRIGKYHLAPEPVYHFDEALPGDPWNSLGMAEESRAFIADKSKPFFLYFCPLTPHRSGGQIEGHPLQPNPFGNHKNYPGLIDVKYDEAKITVPAHLPDTPACRAELAQYYQAISRTDAGLARLIALLKETGQYDHTVILFGSDNGKPWPGAKTTLYEPGMRLPLVVRSPDQTKRGVVSDALVSWVDLTPTILDIAGVREVLAPARQTGDPEGGAQQRAAAKPKPLVKYEFHGRSFLPTLDGATPPGWDVVYGSHQFHEIQMYYPMRAIRTDRHKLILNLAHQLPYPFASDLHASATWQATLKNNDTHYGKRPVSDYVHRPHYELYDLKSDPEELTNLASEPEHKAVFDELAARLKAYQERTRDAWFSKYEYE